LFFDSLQNWAADSIIKIDEAAFFLFGKNMVKYKKVD